MELLSLTKTECGKHFEDETPAEKAENVASLLEPRSSVMKFSRRVSARNVSATRRYEPRLGYSQIMVLQNSTRFICMYLYHYRSPVIRGIEARSYMARP